MAFYINGVEYKTPRGLYPLTKEDYDFRKARTAHLMKLARQKDSTLKGEQNDRL